MVNPSDVSRSAAQPPESTRPRVLFVHGLESSPQGTKAQYLAQRFEALTPAMQTGDFLGCVEQQTQAIEEFQPQVVVGSSYGGAVVVQLLARGVWRGPTLLLAQAARKYDDSTRLPTGVPVLLVHGTQDDVVDCEDSRQLAQTSPDARFLEVDDGHRLTSLTADESLAELIQGLLVR